MQNFQTGCSQEEELLRHTQVPGHIFVLSYLYNSMHQSTDSVCITKSLFVNRYFLHVRVSSRTCRRQQSLSDPASSPRCRRKMLSTKSSSRGCATDQCLCTQVCKRTDLYNALHPYVCTNFLSVCSVEGIAHGRTVAHLFLYSSRLMRQRTH